MACKNPDATESLEPEDFNEVLLDEHYAVQVPYYMKRKDDLHKDVLFGFRSEDGESYLMAFRATEGEASEQVIHNEIDLDSLGLSAAYVELQKQILGSGMQFVEFDSLENISLNGLPAALSGVQGELDKTELSYRLFGVTADEKIYLLIYWTSRKKKVKFDRTFRQIASSFHANKLVED